MRGPFRRRPLRPRPNRPRFPFIPPPGVFRRRRPALEATQRDLVQANRLLETGQASEAGEIFVKVSRLAEQHGMLRRAAHLGARAAYAFMVGQALSRAMEEARRAIELSVQVGDLVQAVQLAQRILSNLESQGHQAEAQKLRGEFDAQLSRLGVSLSGVSQGAPAPTRGSLPAQCPSCLGPVQPDEVEWVAQDGAQCAYCGTILKTE